MTFASAAAVLEHATKHRDSYVSVGCVDWNGRLRTKQLNAEHLTKALSQGTALTSAIFAPDSAEMPIEGSYFQEPANGYRDAWLKLDPAGAYVDPVGGDGLGLVLLGQLTGVHADYCPRALLARECARLGGLGFDAYSAYEMECHVLQETLTTLIHKVPRELNTHPDFSRMYSFVDQAVQAPMFGELRETTHAAGIPLDSLHIEFTGLLEAALAPAVGIVAADRAQMFKTIAKVVARRHAALAVFMAQLSERHESAGGHLNLSLRTAETNHNAFFDADSSTRMSRVFEYFVGGLQRYVPELFVLFAPNLNSFKRFGARSFVPFTNTWAVDNKTVAFRVVTTQPGLTRVEIRIAGADVNPYLTLAAALAAGRRGIEQKIALARPAEGDAILRSAASAAPFPATYAQAIDAFERSAFAQECFGEEFVRAYAQSRRWQLEQHARVVTDWEVRQFAENA